MEPHSHIRAYVILGIFLAFIIGILYFFESRNQRYQIPPTSEEVRNAYDSLTSQLALKPGDPALSNALIQLRNVAADPNKSNLERAKALNGMSFAYSQSNFDAKTIYDAVLSKPPFSVFYLAPTSSTNAKNSVDNPDFVAAVDKAMARLHALSNELYPNHYAISRIEGAEIMAYRREEYQTKNTAVRAGATEKVKALVDQYDALAPLESFAQDYIPSLRMQIMSAHANALFFLWTGTGDASYKTKSEQLYQDILALGESFPKGQADSPRVEETTLYTRMYYAANFWEEYKESNPAKIKDIIRPIIDASPESSLYSAYLPKYANGYLMPIPALRDIAKQMPELKTFLEGRGWKF